MRVTCTAIVFLAIGLSTRTTPAQEMVAATTTGRVRGEAGDVVVFKGIPFAEPPVGDLRWRPPRPAQSWSGIRPATDFAPACMQAADVRKSEECLYLNVWAPDSAFAGGRASLPVLVWVFGGNFTAGSGNIDGRALARRGVIVVSFNYPAIFGAFADETLRVYPVRSDADVAQAIADSFGDSQFVFGARGIARAVSRVNPHVWRYWFRRPRHRGAGPAPSHGAQLPYIMGNIEGPSYDADDAKLSNMMMDAWVRFVATGNPNGGTITEWPAYAAESDPCLILDVRPEVMFGLRNAQLDFIGRVQRAARP